MPVTETSRESYSKLDKLNTRQAEVYRAIGELGIASNREIAQYLGKEINAITPRCKELREMGFVAEHGKKFDHDTNRNVTTWCAVDPNDKNLIDIANDPADDLEPGKWQPEAVGWMKDE